ncbi:DNA-binding NarL/FixJ family response regulator [Limimaricola variabilis]|jgi:DNA-binding NarL/FixJ family response regulator|uniref:DNA-binding NarL/FixJ family response regulator n=1 Tax=Limimaricola variabilis TaxID=1492771 RepID=A0ABR6HN69_9RHOB|nr:response regulator transcription factor [Limimaricola variabilis]MBB3711984.1 DNA-binding NarL/FixJ family response regulator [Limimaricola variabilis]WPY96764.1 response regulator transcription factor [Limimaricola variabilis]
MTVRIVVADDHPIFRAGVITSLEETGEFQVVGAASSAEEAVQIADQTRPDIALLDLSMPGGGLAAVKAISAAGSATHVAMLTVSEEDENVASALKFGAIAYILKGISASELREILKGVARGEAHVSPQFAERVLNYMSQPPQRAPNSPLEDLTKREEDILRCVAKGQSNKEVAEALGLQEKTVKHYMTGIMGKLHARNRVEAALIAHEGWGLGE